MPVPANLGAQPTDTWRWVRNAYGVLQAVPAPTPAQQAASADAFSAGANLTDVNPWRASQGQPINPFAAAQPPAQPDPTQLKPQPNSTTPLPETPVAPAQPSQGVQIATGVASGLSAAAPAMGAAAGAGGGGGAAAGMEMSGAGMAGPTGATEGGGTATAGSMGMAGGTAQPGALSGLFGGMGAAPPTTAAPAPPTTATPAPPAPATPAAPPLAATPVATSPDAVPSATTGNGTVTATKAEAKGSLMEQYQQFMKEFGPPPQRKEAQDNRLPLAFLQFAAALSSRPTRNWGDLAQNMAGGAAAGTAGYLGYEEQEAAKQRKADQEDYQNRLAGFSAFANLANAQESREATAAYREATLAGAAADRAFRERQLGQQAQQFGVTTGLQSRHLDQSKDQYDQSSAAAAVKSMQERRDNHQTRIAQLAKQQNDDYQSWTKILTEQNPGANPAEIDRLARQRAGLPPATTAAFDLKTVQATYPNAQQDPDGKIWIPDPKNPGQRLVVSPAQ